MKKIIIFLLVFVLTNSVAFAQGQQGQGTGQGQQIQTEQQTENQEEENLMIQETKQTRLRTTEELQQMIQERNQEMVQEMQTLKPAQQKVYQNQNAVRLAVHSLLEVKDLIGGIGPQVSQVAQEFNNSLQATIRAEERIQTRNRVVRFFAGGDKNAATAIEQEVNRNRERIELLNQLMEQCECEEGIMAILQEQIRNIEQEQNRLQQLAQNEKQYKGIFGWLFGWLQK
ncbi:MAG: hypothetical protein Q8M94_18060 [Ignavibacteria bacterium]|nr:hypothetical protein [Ignavibacteria bacterium]